MEYIEENPKVGQRRKMLKNLTEKNGYEIPFLKGETFTIERELPYLVKRNGIICCPEEILAGDHIIENYEGFYECKFDNGKIGLFSGVTIKLDTGCIEYNGYDATELSYVVFPDEKRKLLVPPIVDVSKENLFENVREELWCVVKKYYKIMGLRLEQGCLESSTIYDQTTIDGIQNVIFKTLEDMGVKFKKE